MLKGNGTIKGEVLESFRKSCLNNHLTKEEREFIDSLEIGVENAKHSYELKGTPRYIRIITASLRKKGIAICSGEEGYWIPKNEEEIRSTYLKLKASARELDRVAEGMYGKKSWI